MKILAVANQKGGVAKSTLVVHLAYYAAMEQGLRVLLIDTDAQGSLGMTFPTTDGDPGLVASTLFDETPGDDQPEILNAKLSIIRADNGLLDIDKAGTEVFRRPGRAIRKFADEFDVCFIDTPPLLGVRLMSALSAADYVVTPVSVGLYELAGLAALMQSINVVKSEGFNTRLKHLGILPVKTNSRSSEEKLALAALRAQYGNAILPENLAERAAVRKAISNRKPVWQNTQGQGHLLAGKEWYAACDSILKRLVS